MRFCWLLLCLCCANVLAQTKPVVIHYALVFGEEGPHLPYMKALLHLACDEMKTPCQLQPALNMNQKRALAQMGLPKGKVDLLWGMTNQQREQQTLPIRIPLDKGLSGWRLAVVPVEKHAQFAKVRTLAQLATFRAGLSRHWPDTAIFHASRLPVVVSNRYASLFPMLRRGRYDYFPRSVLEVQHELALPKAHGLVVEPYLLLRYPAAWYFFVSPHRPELAKMLEQGLEKAIKNGRFERTFRHFNGEALRSLNLTTRRVINLANPGLPVTIPLNRRELWYRP